MKRFFIAAVAVLMMSSVAMAQDANKQNKKFNRTEIIQKRTDKMVKQYGLNKEQAAKLLTLNTEYAAKWNGRAGLHGGIKGGMHGKQGFKGGMKCGGSGMKGCANCACCKDSVAMAKMKQECLAKMKVGREKMKASMKGYNTKLKGIMTAAQYAKYQDNLKQQKVKMQGKMRKFNHRTGGVKGQRADKMQN